MKVGLFFGSFNPIHIGHLAIANIVHELANLDEVWYVVSPHSPFKEKEGLLSEQDRLMLVELSILDNHNLRTCDVEFDLEQPNYTYKTLTKLYELHPDNEFSIIMGADNLIGFDKWENYKEILKNHNIMVYPRPHSDVSFLVNHPKVKLYDAPQFEISATFIRECIKAGKSVKYLLAEEAEDYIKKHKLYLTDPK